MRDAIEASGLARRAVLKGGAAALAVLGVSGPFEALARAGCRRRGPDYGPLFETLDETTGLPLLKLPRGFEYLSMGWTGDPMVGGRPTPGAHDGGGCIRGVAGRVFYIRNHERRYNASAPSVDQVSFADPSITYDRGQAPGGTTTMIFDETRGRFVRAYASLSGTIRNCAGGVTPWASWLTCEETLDEPGGAATLEETHGWVFEVPAWRHAVPEPLRALGRFNHEAVAVDPRNGAVYETEDTGSSGIYRMLPRAYAALHRGGKLQMLRVKGSPGLQTRTGLPVGTVLDVDWVDIADPERRDDSPGDGRGVFAQGFAQGGAVFSRGEGMWYGERRIYFTCTDGGAARKGQVWELDPSADRLRLIYESPGAAVLDNPDNLLVTPRGGIVLCEDGSQAGQFLRGLTITGTLFDLAQNNVVLDGEVHGIAGDFRGSEWAGAAFTPNGEWLIASIQTPGITFAITGPWCGGPL
jgi:secreted PhoX family phosphatase